mmetsp:Transcript_30022/g.54715  ORF Transcript_30022/g.54715 Transcript_30022/m.54715 type:complete len:112 (-) Transcript_30022:71-406(-)
MAEILAGITSLIAKVANHGAGSEPENSAKNQDLLNKINSGQYQARVEQEPFQSAPGQQVGGASASQPTTADEVREARLARLDPQSSSSSSGPAAAAEGEQAAVEPSAAPRS